jgi:sugar O-acyltransferase (sialic acid O-acetyltransferase NeuD family)
LDKIVIYGNGAVAIGTHSSLKNNPRYEVVAFTVDRKSLKGNSLCELPVVPFDTVKNVYPPETHKMIIAVGYVRNNRIKRDRYLQAKEMGYQLPNFISPASIVPPGTSIGDNCVIDSFTVIGSTARIGNNVSIGPGCIIGEDVVIGDHCFFSGGAAIAGFVNIGACCYFGLRATVRNKVSIGNDCVIGAGALMLENAEDGSVYMGEQATLLPISSDKLPLA